MCSKRKTCTNCGVECIYQQAGPGADTPCGDWVAANPAPAPCSGCGWEHDEIHNPTDTCATCNGGSRYHPPTPAPAPLPSFAFDSHTHALKFIAASLTDLGGEQEALDTVCAHISDLTRRLAGAEAQLASREQELLDTLNRLVDERGTLRGKAEAAEARVREMEATIDAMAEAHAHDDQALTAAYLSGAHAGKKQAEDERDALRERCEKLEAALVEIGESEDRICGYCEGEGNRYADGKAHYYSEHAPTIPCPECGGRGRIRDMDSEDMAAVANAALATEVKP